MRRMRQRDTGGLEFLQCLRQAGGTGGTEALVLPRVQKPHPGGRAFLRGMWEALIRQGGQARICAWTPTPSDQHGRNQVFCRQCGKELAEGVSFCSYCWKPRGDEGGTSAGTMPADQTGGLTRQDYLFITALMFLSLLLILIIAVT